MEDATEYHRGVRVFELLFNFGFTVMFLSLLKLFFFSPVGSQVIYLPCILLFVSQEVCGIIRQYHTQLEQIISKASHERYRTYRASCVCLWFHVSCALLILTIVRGGDLGAVLHLNLSICTMAVSLFKLVATSEDFIGMARWVIAQCIVVTLLVASQGYAYTVCAIFPALPAFFTMRVQVDKLYGHRSYLPLSSVKLSESGNEKGSKTDDELKENTASTNSIIAHKKLYFPEDL